MDLRERKYQESGKHSIMTIFIICTSHKKIVKAGYVEGEGEISHTFVTNPERLKDLSTD